MLGEATCYMVTTTTLYCLLELALKSSCLRLLNEAAFYFIIYIFFYERGGGGHESYL